MSYWLAGIPDAASTELNFLTPQQQFKRVRYDSKINNSDLHVWASWPAKYATDAIYYKGRVAPTLYVQADKPTEANCRKLGVFLESTGICGCPLVSVHVQVLGLTPSGQKVLYGTHTMEVITHQ